MATNQPYRQAKIVVAKVPSWWEKLWAYILYKIKSPSLPPIVFEHIPCPQCGDIVLDADIKNMALTIEHIVCFALLGSMMWIRIY